MRALLNVALDLADDLGVACAVAVVNRAGALRGAERPGSLPGEHIDGALASARALLATGARGGGPRRRRPPLRLDGGGRGALAVAGGPDGFAVEACRAWRAPWGSAPGARPWSPPDLALRALQAVRDRAAGHLEAAPVTGRACAAVGLVSIAPHERELGGIDGGPISPRS